MLGTHLALLDKPVSEGAETTNLEQEFKHVISMRFPSDHFFSIAMEECNAAKNRSIENLPCKFENSVDGWIHVQCVSPVQ